MVYESNILHKQGYVETFIRVWGFSLIFRMNICKHILLLGGGGGGKQIINIRLPNVMVVIVLPLVPFIIKWHDNFF